MKLKEKFQSFKANLPFNKRENYTKKHALMYLNFTQFGGALNDNLYKFLTVFLLIDLLGVGKSNQILFWTGTIYVLPFLLFSTLAGHLADKFSKQKLIIILKAFEVFTMILGTIAFVFKHPIACYSVLFLLSAQSAFFGPPKFSIIPELVKKENISRANGLVTSFSYLAIIFGTFLASGLTQITNRNFLLSISVCVLIALGGLGTSVFIPATPARRATTQYTPLFLKQIYQTLKYTLTIKNLFLILFAGATFLFIGAFFQLNIIPYAIESLGLSEIGGGYLFLVTAIGIALGSMAAGKISKHYIELGLSVIGGLGISILFVFLSFVQMSLAWTIPVLFFIGVFGGMFIVPLDSYIQDSSPIEKRGQIIAANYFLSFVGVLLAPICLYTVNEIIGLKAATGFGIVGVFILVLVATMLVKLSPPLFNFLSRRLICPFYDPDMSQYPPSRKAPFSLILPDYTFAKAFLLFGCEAHLQLIIPKHRKRAIHRFFKALFPVTFIYTQGNDEFALGTFLEKAKKLWAKQEVACLLFSNTSFITGEFAKKTLEEFMKNEGHEIFFVDYTLIPQAKRQKKSGSRLINRLTLTFNKEYSELDHKHRYIQKVIKWKK